MQHDALDGLAELKPVINLAYEEWRSTNKESSDIEPVSEIGQYSAESSQLDKANKHSSRPAIVQRIARETLPSSHYSEYSSIG